MKILLCPSFLLIYSPACSILHGDSISLVSGCWWFSSIPLCFASSHYHLHQLPKFMCCFPLLAFTWGSFHM